MSALSLGEGAVLAVVVLPAVVGSVLLVTGRPWRGAAPVSVVTAAVVAVATIPAAAGGAHVGTPFLAGAELGLAAVGPARVLLPLLGLVALVVCLAATGLEETSGRQATRFHGFTQLFVAAACLTVLATSLPALLLGWEVMGATSCALVALHWREGRHVASGTTAFLTTRAADLGLYVAAGAALAGGAGLALDGLAATSPGWRHVAAAGLLVAALGKAAQLPFSFWLDRAMDGPAPVSALLHSAAMVALGGYLALRVAPLLSATGWADDAAAWTGACTAVLLGAVALVQTDLKRALAASTAAQLGFVVAAAGVAGGVTAGTAHLLGHAGVKAALFLAAGVWLQAHRTRDLAELAGALRRSRVLAAAVVLALLALAGLPPLALWATKDLVLAGALHHSVALYAVLLVAAALSSAYAVRLLVLLARPAPHLAREARPVGGATVPAVLVLSLGGLAGGLLAGPAVAETLARTTSAGLVHPTLLELVASAAVAFAAAGATAALVLRRGTRAPGAARLRSPGWGLEPLVHRLLVQPTAHLAATLDRVDARLDRLTLAAVTATTALAGSVRRADARLDRLTGASASITGVLARWTRRADVSGVDAVVRAVAHGAQRAARAALSPQTGQVHHYYLQSVVVLGAAVLALAGAVLLDSVR